MRKFTDIETKYIKSVHASHRCKYPGETFKRTDRLYTKTAVAEIPAKYWGRSFYNPNLKYELRIEPVEGGLHFYLGGHIPAADGEHFGIRVGTVLDYTVDYSSVLGRAIDDIATDRAANTVVGRTIDNFFDAAYSIITSYGMMVQGMRQTFTGSADVINWKFKTVDDMLIQ